MLYHGLRERGVPVVCIESRQACQALKSLATHKTDRNDARVWAHLGRTGFFKAVHVKSLAAHAVRSLIIARKKLVGQRVTLENQIRGLAVAFGVRLPIQLSRVLNLLQEPNVVFGQAVRSSALPQQCEVTKRWALSRSTLARGCLWPLFSTMAKISYAGYRFPPEIIQQTIWLYLRFTLSFRDVEDLLAERGITVSYETIRRWANHFGPMIAADLRKRRPKPHTIWHLDEGLSQD